MRSSWNCAPPSINDSARRNEAPRSVRQLVDNFLSPFVRCVQPQFQACVVPDYCRDEGMIRWTGSIIEGKQSFESVTQFCLETPHRNDVLCGRSSESTRHPGNKQFKSVIQVNKAVYGTLTKKQKMHMSQQVVDLIHHIGGRFRARNALTGHWEDVGIPRSLEKTSQAFRSTPGAEEVPTSPPSGRQADAPPLCIPPALEAIFRLQESSPLPPPPPPSQPPPLRASTGSASSERSQITGQQIFRPKPVHAVTPGIPGTYSHPQPPPATPFQYSFASIERVNSMPVPSTQVKRTSFDAMETPVGPELLPGYHKRAKHPTSILYETDAVMSPSALTQSRLPRNEDGLAALSAAAYLRLDEME